MKQNFYWTLLKFYKKYLKHKNNKLAIHNSKSENTLLKPVNELLHFCSKLKILKT